MPPPGLHSSLLKQARTKTCLLPAPAPQCAYSQHPILQKANGRGGCFSTYILVHWVRHKKINMVRGTYTKHCYKREQPSSKTHKPRAGQQNREAKQEGKRRNYMAPCQRRENLKA